MSGSDASTAHRLDRGTVGLSLLVLGSAFAAARTQPLWGPHVRLLCPLLELTGIPCPTCGGTRALLALAAADLPAALAWNPLVAVAGIVAAAWSVAAAGMLAGALPLPLLPTRLPAWVRWAVVAAVVANQAWLLYAARV